MFELINNMLNKVFTSISNSFCCFFVVGNYNLDATSQNHLNTVLKINNKLNKVFTSIINSYCVCFFVVANLGCS